MSTTGRQSPERKRGGLFQSKRSPRPKTTSKALGGKPRTVILNDETAIPPGVTLVEILTSDLAGLLTLFGQAGRSE